MSGPAALDDAEMEALELHHQKRPLTDDQMAALESATAKTQQAKAAKAAPPAAQAPSGWERVGGKALDAARGLGAGATLGFGDELNGVVGAGLDKLTGEKGDFAELYRQNRDMARKGNAESKERSPYTYGATELAGNLAAPGAGGGVGRALLAGGAYGLGNSSADITQGDFAPAAKDAAIAAVASGAGQQVGQRVLSPALRKLGAWLQPALKESAEESAVKGFGAIQGDLKKLRGDVSGDGGYGRRLLDARMPTEDGGAGEKLLGFGSGKKALLERSEAFRQAAGEREGGILQFLDEKGGKPFDWEKAGARINKSMSQMDPVEQQVVSKAFGDMQNAFDKARDMGGGFALANQMKTSLYKNIGHWVPDPAMRTALSQKLAGIFNKEIETQLGEQYGALGLKKIEEAAAANAAERGAASAGSGLMPALRGDELAAPAARRVTAVPVDPDAAAKAAQLGDEALRQFKEAKNDFGLGAQASGWAKKGVDRELGNRTPSLTDYLAILGGIGAGGAGHGGMGATAIAFGLANKMLRERGRASAAVAADVAQKGLAKALPYLQNGRGGAQSLQDFSAALAREIAAEVNSRQEPGAKP